jgi:ABC-2 type transport system permease protein
MVFKRYLKIWGLQIKSSLMQRMAYQFNFVFMCLGSFTQIVLTIIFIKVIFSFINNLSGWNYEQAMVVVASYMLVEGLVWATCSYLSGITTNIKNGNIDFALVKPIDAQFLLSVWRCDPEDWVRVASGLIIFVYSLIKLKIGLVLLLIKLPIFIILIINAYIITYGFNLIIKTFAFWTQDSNGLWTVGNAVSKMTQYPTDIFFHKTVRLLLSSIIPLAFMATVPAKALIWGISMPILLSSFCLAFVFFYISRKFFLYSFRYYSSASS